MKKKIIFVAQALWVGGIETALVNLLNHLDYEKYEITCLITEDYQQMAKLITSKCNLIISDRNHTVSFSEKYKFNRIFSLMEEPQNASWLRRMVWKGLCFSLKSLEMKLYASYIRKQLGGQAFDTAVIYSDRTAEIAVRAINADRYIMFYHNADIGRAYHDKYGYNKSEKIVAVSEEQRKKLQIARPKYASKMIAIQNYIDVETTRSRSQEIIDKLFPHTGIHLVSCGRLAYQKGFDLAINACKILVDEGFDNIHWYILGNGPLKEDLEKQIKNQGMDNHFHLLGVKSNPFPYMEKADIYVQPSRTEGYSLSILEARVLACPTVATLGAAEEQLSDGITGTLCNPDSESIANGIRKHLLNPGLAELYRENLSSFNFDEINHDIISKVESLL